MSLVLLEYPRPDIALITLNRPERMNSMAFDLMVPLKESLETVGNDNSVRVVVLTGRGAVSRPVRITSRRVRCRMSTA
ncbi:enoyl-CoA hydratase/isomerase family protein [Mycobacterium kansasii 732]|nr:enoyl-CoA hydratase/isomerase family protein [Mycobacterium kansasii 732]